jgi:hypothetical protein
VDILAVLFFAVAGLLALDAVAISRGADSRPGFDGDHRRRS